MPALSPTATRPDERARRSLSLLSAEAVSAEVHAVLEAVPAWCHARASEAGLLGAWRDWSKALPSPPVQLGMAPAASVPVGDYAVGEAYVEALSPADRSMHGRHYTPSALGGHLWTLVRRETCGSSPPICDPAAGANALLLPALPELLDRTPDPAEAIRAAGEVVAGRDLDRWPCGSATPC